ncbi:MAG: 50S ribosomal protein L2 [Rickettsiaceae bacterium H1]|nr:50S ribosomal protein L2 [Rickettsiaceae bacterium H1]
MTLKVLKPLNSSFRGTVLNSFGVSNSKPKKSLLISLSNNGGRNNRGVITVRHMGGGHKKRYRLIDFKRRKSNGVVQSVEYDPYRTSYISLVKYDDDSYRYILSPDSISVGDCVLSGLDAEINVGNSLPLGEIPVGTLVHNIELKIGKGGVLARAAGNYAQIVGKDDKYTLLRLRSGQSRYVLSKCFATIGIVSNQNNKGVKLGKAGRARWKGVRPTVRGVAMNPVDHPHGGGEGRTSGGRHPVSPWGLLTKGKKTRNMKKASNKYIKFK